MKNEKLKDTHAGDDRFIVRFHDDGMRQSLKLRAAKNERSLNAEILYLLKKGIAAEVAPKHQGAV